MNKKAGRNDPCPCGSSKKYKKCCWNKDHAPGLKKFNISVVNQAAGGLAQRISGDTPVKDGPSLRDRISKGKP